MPQFTGKLFLAFNMGKIVNYLGKYFFYFLLGTIVFILLYPKFPFINVPGTYVAIRLEDFLITLLLFLWFLVNFKNLKIILSKTIFKAFIIFWLIGFLSIFSGLYITYSIHLNLSFFHWLRRVEMMSLFFVAATTIKNQKQIKTILRVLLIANIIIIIYGFGQVFLEFPVISTTNKEFSKGLILKLSPDARANSTFAGHYDLAAYLSIVVTFMGSLIFYYRRFWEKGLLLIWGVVSFVLLGMTAARMSFTATLGSLALVFWIMGKRLLIVGLLVLALGAVAIIPELRHRLVATITVNLLEGGGPKYSPPPNKTTIFTPQNNTNQASFEAITRQSITESTAANRVSTVSADIAAGEPINTTELGVYRSFNIRTDVEWPRAVRAFVKNPILGTGYSSINLATDNDILRSLGETGLLGTLSLLLIFFIILKRFIKAIKKSENFEKIFIIATICSMIAILATGLIIDILEASKITALLWTMLGICWAVSGRYNYED